ncbi:1-acyl-sn-glycerol-3-phosphate acyltransferase [Labrenzia sp. CE80]|uniref:GNAT family N-acetyltransferase n=1 Tax=Labrenzia sp. CE80 TaxID=1788986 RepID=UPI002570ACB2|nr:1-acyl-sn-glycerol-3-phosphate acyltransferase [Labrenzia sp. CE80]
MAYSHQTTLALSKEGETSVGRGHQHIVDTLIDERGRQVMAAPWWPLLRPIAFRILRYRQALEMANAIAPLPAQDVFDHLSELLQLNVEVAGLENVPADGPIVLVSNHPTGIADGVVLYDAIGSRRKDLSIFANRDAIRINPRLAEMIVPVEWRPDFKNREKTRETLKLAADAFAQNRAIVLFPSGRLAYWNEGRLTERPWMTSALALARRNKVPVIPVHMGGRNSGLFYFLARVSTELRDMTVFNELLNKKKASFKVHFGQPIDPKMLEGDLNSLTERMRTHCAETLGQNPKAVFEEG